MADYNFPAEIEYLQSGYARQETSRFITSQPSAGSYYAQIVSDDAPFYFDLQIIAQRQDAFIFREWLAADNYAVLTGAQFNIDIWGEDGLASQEASFLPDGIPQITQTIVNLIYYSARIVVRRPRRPGVPLETEGGDLLVTESGDLITTEGATA